MLNKFKSLDKVTQIIIVNVAVFLLAVITNMFAHLFQINEGLIVSILALKARLSDFIFQPWGILTHMFLHESFSHILWNMLLFYFMGQMFQRHFSQKLVLPLYLASGLVGAIALIVSYLIFPLFQNSSGIALGASAAVMGVFIAMCAYRPNDEVYLYGLIKVPLKYMGIGVVALDFIMFNQGNEGGHIAHLGGAAYGFYFITQYKKGRNILTPWVKIIDAIVTMNLFKRKPKLKVVHKQKAQYMKDEDYNASKKTAEEQMNAILDKISKSGYNSLTKAEKEFLQKFQ